MAPPVRMKGWGDGMDQSGETELTEVERIKIDRTYDRLKKLNYYEVLNLPQQADKSQIKRAYYAVSKEYHPDRYFRRNLGAYKDKLEAIFDLITRSYNTLNDDGLRATYDRSLIEESFRQRPMEYEISVESVLKPTGTGAKPGAGAPPTSGAPPAGAGPAQANPLFLDRLQNQLMGRLVKAREQVKMGREALDKGQFAQAMSAFQIALSYDPNNAEARLYLEKAQTQFGEVKADQLYQKGIQSEALGNSEGARTYFKQAVECKPKKGMYYFKLGVLQIDSEAERRQGLENLKQAVQYEGRNVEYLLALAQAYEQVGMPRNALREYEKIVTIEKGHDIAVKALKRLKSSIGS